MKVIVTGVSGYIGGQVALQLKAAGHTVIGIDREGCTLPVRLDKFIKADFASVDGLAPIMLDFPDAIIHCAGTSLVGPSMADPAEYYNNNVVKKQQLQQSNEMVVQRSVQHESRKGTCCWKY